MKKSLFVMIVLAVAAFVCFGTLVAKPQGTQTLPLSSYRTATPTLKDGGPRPTSAVAVTRPELPAVGSRNPNSLDEVFISENFDAITPGQLPAGWTYVDVDGITAPLFGGPSVWQVWEQDEPGLAHSGTKMVANAYNTGGLANDDWLILPQQNLTGTITLSYWDMSISATWLENYEIRVSTTGTLPANFTNLLYTGTDVPVTWTQRTVNLSAYAGAPFYIAIHYNAVDEFMLVIDDLMLEATGAGGPRGGIEGTVTAAVGGAALSGVAVLASDGRSTTTNASGYYVIGNFTPAAYSLTFSKVGYATLTVPNNTVIVSDTITVNAALQPGLTPVFTENFDAIEDWEAPATWTMIDGDHIGSLTLNGEDSRWLVLNIPTFAHSAPSLIINGRNVDGSDNDDWLILPRQNCTGGISLSYWVRGWQPTLPESYEVRVSTTGDDADDFTNLIYSDANVGDAYVQHTHDLSAYAGAPFYIAFHYNASAQAAIFIDDVQVDAGAAVSAGPSITGIVRNDDNDPIAFATVKLAGTTWETLTDLSGHYSLLHVDAGTYSVEVTHPLLDTTVVENITLAGDATTTTNVVAQAVVTATLDLESISAPVTIVDNDTVQMDMDVSESREILDLDVKLNITHTWVGDMSIWLVAPTGERIFLASGDGYDGDNFTNAWLDDEADIRLHNGLPPYNGVFRPAQNLRTFDHLMSDGTWSLFVSDAATGDAGSIDDFTLHITYATTGAVDEPTVASPFKFAFNGSYPNPFNARTTFQFSLAQTGNVALVLYNVAGQEVARVIDNASMTAGSHTIGFDAATLSSGVYFARLSADHHTATHKIALLK